MPMASGLTPLFSKAKKCPLRPMPHWTSSSISSAPRSVQSARSSCRKLSSAGKMPPSPCIDSINTAATVSSTSLSKLSMLLSWPNLKPSSIGRKPPWIFSWGVAAMPPKVRPWKASSAATTVYRFASSPPLRLRPCSRASLISASLDSAPLLQNSTRPGPAFSTSRSASFCWPGMPYRLLQWLRVVAWSCTALTHFGCE